MSNWQWWLRSQLRRLRDSDSFERARFILHRQLHSSRRLAVAVCGVLVILYFIFFSGPTSKRSLSQLCLEGKIRTFNASFYLNSSSSYKDGFFFVGNGFIGVGKDGELRIASEKTLSTHTGFYPLVSVNVPEAEDVNEAILTNFQHGKMHSIKCFTIDGECACVSTTIFAHRTKRNLLVQDIQIANPTKSSLAVVISRSPSIFWKAENADSEKDSPVLVRNDIGGFEKFVGVIICSSAPGEMNIQPKREESVRFTCSLEVLPRRSDGGESVKRIAMQSAIEAFHLATNDWSKIEKEHEDAWTNLQSPAFYIDHSLAPNVLNSELINRTRYAILSNVLVNAERKTVQRDLCYTGHSTMLFPSKLWQPYARTADEIVSLVHVWLVTLEKRGCMGLLKTGAHGVTQAIVLSLIGASFHHGHLEVGLDPADLHRHVSVSGIVVNESISDTMSFHINILTDNRPHLIVSSSGGNLFGCDAGCMDEPVLLSQNGIELPVKVTKPLTSILYVAVKKEHLQELKNAIHVADVDVAPAHDNDVIEMHKNGGGGSLPTSVWLILGVILVTFHVFLIKLLYSEWRKGDTTPYNPYIRMRMLSRSH